MSIALFKEPLPEPMSFKTIELISQQSITSHVVPPHCHNHQPFVHDCKNNGQNSIKQLNQGWINRVDLHHLKLIVLKIIRSIKERILIYCNWRIFTDN